ncbi:TIR domain-containing protein [Nocardioides kribbensis]|uniref:TIR domain-containing protein n=1 Tax=Nocardioides kribbensis TaxID=305517 RepID=A0ABV1NTF7_9ACTN
MNDQAPPDVMGGVRAWPVGGAARSADVFICFAEEHAVLADQMVAEIERRGLRAWVYHRDVPAGRNYHVEAVDAIESSRAVVVLFSEHTQKSRHCQSEVSVAYDAELPILPLRLDETPLKEMKYALNLLNWKRDLNDVVEDLTAVLAVPLGGGPGAGTVLDADVEVPSLPVMLGLDPTNLAASFAAAWNEPLPRRSLVVPVDGAGPLPSDLGDSGVTLLHGVSGSGLSSTLISIVASLMARHPPDQLRVAILGPGNRSHEALRHAPHVLATSADVDEYQARRWLDALDAELAHRAKGLRGVRFDPAAPPPDMPRLLLAIDDPTFLRENYDLVDGLATRSGELARVGIHLLVAAPRLGLPPSLLREARTRIAHRTHDSTDSERMLGRGDAARIPAARPGRVAIRYATGEVRYGHVSHLEDIDAFTYALAAAWADRPTPMMSGFPTDLDRVGKRLSIMRALELRARNATSTRALVVVGTRDVSDDDLETVNWEHTSNLLITGGPRSGRTTSALAITAALVAHYGAGQVAPIGFSTRDTRIAESLSQLPGNPACVQTAEQLREILQLLKTAQQGNGEAHRPRIVLLIDDLEQLRSHGEIRDDLTDVLLLHRARVHVLATGNLLQLGAWAQPKYFSHAYSTGETGIDRLALISGFAASGKRAKLPAEQPVGRLYNAVTQTLFDVPFHSENPGAIVEVFSQLGRRLSS